MGISLAYLGPPGTNSEAAALAYSEANPGEEVLLCPYPDIARTLRSVAQGEADLAIVPIENSIGGSVAISLDLFWELDGLQIQQALILPIAHVLLSRAESLEAIAKVYSHPQAIAQCQRWLERSLPQAQLVAMNSTTEALDYLDRDLTAAAIASPRAAHLYELPILAGDISDFPGNCTRFWVVGLQPSTGGSHISLAFGTAANVPGALVKPLQIFAKRSINMSRIESRPTKRLLGEYIFFIDLEVDATQPHIQAALAELAEYATPLKIFGNYDVVALPPCSLT
ncbi:prephenate dehydratase [Oscillatoria sp. FACHB-1406]|uniref:prephenate dehydratase n=1 Tax=Oscillatoria sp. FACHB-1406 TaxID=2692846 RepID=UPI0016843196|nr:prephenate dehydratase [Oscillatoria sp. FACHB-1406]MBD2577520.1 prephenate dehydratase [Oscillatoria sp. FACHB-1406]